MSDTPERGIIPFPTQFGAYALGALLAGVNMKMAVLFYAVTLLAAVSVRVAVMVEARQ